VALAVGLTPELLPMIVSVTFARGAQRMAPKRVIVKQLVSIQNLGSMDVLCTDKTGTLTEARIHLERHLDGLGRESGRVLQLAHVKNKQYEENCKAHDKQPEASGTLLKCGGRRLRNEAVGNITKHCICTGLAN
jgi:Mg2+-importing ATPase